MADAHRLIELQSPQDLAYIQEKIRAHALAKIDLHLPPAAAPAGEDAFRRRVEEEIARYLTDTFRGLRSNVSVNGVALPLEGEQAEGHDELEAPDARLRERIRELEALKESLTEQVADLRRSAPGKAAKAWAEAVTKDEEAWDEELRRGREAALKRAQESRVDTGEFKRKEDVCRTWEQGVEELVALKEGLTESVARLERAGEVVQYMEGR